MFRTVPLYAVWNFSLHTHSSGMCHTGLLTACEQDQDGTSYMLVVIFPSHQT